MLLLVAALAALWPATAEQCGGVLTEPSGVIQTPAFPAPLSVPVRCHWLVDSSGLPDADVQIIVYLTQLYVTSGLTFTEYAFYDPMDASLQRNPSLLLSVTEQNSVTTRWLSTRSRFLVVELELERLEGNHLRVLDHLLDVFGFNITYEMTTTPVRNNSCSVIDCSFAGNCYVSPDNRDFWCSCFTQFSGPSCNFGPICQPDNGPCLNGGVCRHAGKYPTCTCPQGYTGSRCEAALYDAGCEDSECLVQCRMDGREESTCGCGLRIEGDRWRYVLTLKLSNISSLAIQHPGRTLSNYLEKQVQRFFRPLSLSRFEDLQILNISDNGQMSFHFFADRHDLSKVRDGQQRMTERGRIGELLLFQSPSRLRHEQGLRLERTNQFLLGSSSSITDDHNRIKELDFEGLKRRMIAKVTGIHVSNREVFVNEEVILSCIAQGSEQIEFSWYKDGYSIDANKGSGGLWMQILPKNSRDEYTAILGIDSVKVIDEGRYTCHVTDWGIQECKSVYLEIQSPPIVQVSPMSASLNKGDHIDLTCVSTNQRVSYSWTRDKNLFALNPGLEVWEELKPWGSILRISNIQKSVTYTCHAQTRAATREKSVRINLLTPGSCQEIEEAGILWKPTAPGALAMAECPPRYIGHSSRYCLTIRAGKANWEEPDFSNCVSESLDQLITDFQMISRGYMKSSLWFVLSELYSWFNSRDPCLRGEGEPVLDLLSEVAAFVNRTFTSEEVLNVTKVFYANVDLLLSQPNSFIHSGKVGELQKLVDQWSLMWSEHMNITVAHLSYSEIVIDVIKLNNEVQYRYYIPMLTKYVSYPRWYTANLGIDVMTQAGNQMNRVTIVNYRNISKFLPRTSSQILSDGNELLYEMHSNIVSISTSGDVKIRLEMLLPVSGHVRDNWNLTCARSDLVGLEWDFTSCHLDPRARNSSRCLCHKPGLYAALVTRHSSDKLMDAARVLSSPLVALGCGSCLVQSCLTLLLLGCRRAFVQLLKIQFCLAICVVMVIFIYVTRVAPTEDMYQFLTILLELLFFLALSSHLGMLLIIYTEVVFIPNFKSVKRTVMGLTTGVTVLPCLISGTAESFSTSKSKSSWWLPIGSASFYTATAAGFLIICLFLMLSVGLLRRLHYLRAVKGTKSKHIIDRRLGLMKRTSALFIATVLVTISSVLFVNAPNTANIYIFSSLSALLGFLIFLCYILHSESSLNPKLMKQLKITAKDQDYGSDSDYNLFNFFTKQEAEVESEGAPPIIKGDQGIALKEISEKITTKPKLVTFSDQPQYEKNVRSVDLEVYPNSPKKYSKAVGGESTSVLSSLDIIPIRDTGDSMEPNETSDSIANILPSVVKSELSEESLSAVSPSEVLNRISHDLDYLLNRQASPQLPMKELAIFPRRKPQGSSPPSAGSSHIGKTTL